MVENSLDKEEGTCAILWEPAVEHEVIQTLLHIF